MRQYQPASSSSVPTSRFSGWPSGSEYVSIHENTTSAVLRAVEQHLLRVALDLRDALGGELTELRHAHDVEAIPVERVDVIAVRLHEVGFVDALLLVVRAGEVDAFLATAAAAVVGAGALARLRRRAPPRPQWPAWSMSAQIS